MTFAQRIKEVRQEMELTQAQFGDLVGKAESTVRMWELGSSFPTCKALMVIAQRTGKTSDYLLGISDGREVADNA